ncbi:MAG: hypothetical protein KF736_12745 [Acidobacteria bacterium]|nr:hypothetical protein [Acidobacteriota bacterium]MCW5950422.1 hypothetical protein [Pyrinomonadaceae bacterium]
MKIILLNVFLSSLVAISGCNVQTGNSPNTANTSNAAANEKPAAGTASPTPETKPEAAKIDCKGLSMPGKIAIPKQTFPFDNEPFKGSCFATFGSKEDMLDAKDLPRGSTFHIFKDGKKVYDLPDAFDGMGACWVEAISFDDLNGDKLVDVIMAGSCLSARDSYPQNAVYVNTGKGFTTDSDANEKLQGMKTAKAIEDYVRKHTKEFFK